MRKSGYLKQNHSELKVLTKDVASQQLHFT